jgi:hypothetical protein
MARFLLLSDSCEFVDVGCSLWREDGSTFTIAAGPRQRCHSRVRVPRDSWPYFTVSDSRLPQPGRPSPLIYISQEQGGPVIPPGTGFPFHRFLRLAGLRWRYSNPPPRGVNWLTSDLRLDWLLIYDWTTCLEANHRKHIRCPAVDICEPHRQHRVLYCCIYSAVA